MTRSKGRTGRPWLRLAAQVKAEESICGICGRGVDKTLPSSHPWSATIDHKIPISKAPHLERERSNLQLAHRWCNTSKGNTTPHGINTTQHQLYKGKW